VSPGRSGASTTRRRPRPSDDGQSTVELVLGLPVVLLLALVLIQVGQLVHHRILVTHAAREAARAASVAGGRVDGVNSVGLTSGLDPDRLRVDVSGPNAAGLITVTVTFVDPTDVAIVGALAPDVTLRSSASMTVEG